jgi:hypothetical protein
LYLVCVFGENYWGHILASVSYCGLEGLWHGDYR